MKFVANSKFPAERNNTNPHKSTVLVNNIRYMLLIKITGEKSENKQNRMKKLTSTLRIYDLDYLKNKVRKEKSKSILKPKQYKEENNYRKKHNN